MEGGDRIIWIMVWIRCGIFSAVVGMISVAGMLERSGAGSFVEYSLW